MPNPVRIYVLHHPDSELGARLTDRIYDWFRLPSLEGIPVYVRSAPEKGNVEPSLPASHGTDPNELEYLIPLVDAHMVRDPHWHDYLTKLAKGCQKETATPGTHGWVMFPVGLDPSAFNLPKMITRRNFIRHGMSRQASVRTAAEQEALEAEETLKHLTEAMARDLSGRVFPEQAAARFKIFISYSRADSTDIAKSLRDYIQGETQCEVFLDENDIAFGQAFDESLRTNVDDHAKAMIVVNGDTYADRPWCRWEIGRFTQPRPVSLDRHSSAPGEPGRQIYVFHPLLVVDAVRGPGMTRVLPELSQAPLIRWEPNRAKLSFSVLMREVLLGLKDILVARQVLADEDLSASVVVNRLPGPVAIECLLRKKKGDGEPEVETIHYPGNGLPLIELRLLKRTFGGVRFQAFRDIVRKKEGGLELQRQALYQCLEGVETKADAGLPLRHKVIALSTARCPEDLAALGYLPQHQDEAIIHLLRPLMRMGADVLYGGYPPTVAASRPGESWSANRNLTSTLLELLADERRENDLEENEAEASRKGRSSLVFNVSAWPRCQDITHAEEATWINTCRILRVTPEDARLPPWTLPINEKNPFEGYLRYVACTVSEMRRRMVGRFNCHLPADGHYVVEPALFIFIGGKRVDFSGIMPGIMEEFLAAAATKRPIYLVGGLGGAAGIIAEALCARKSARRPAELTVAYYLEQPVRRCISDYAKLLKQLKKGDPDPQERFDALWALIQQIRTDGLAASFKNGLSDAENKTLLTTPNTFQAVGLIWEGILRAPGLVAPAARRKR